MNFSCYLGDNHEFLMQSEGHLCMNEYSTYSSMPLIAGKFCDERRAVDCKALFFHSLLSLSTQRNFTFLYCQS